jgi:hypothetical protein
MAHWLLLQSMFLAGLGANDSRPAFSQLLLGRSPGQRGFKGIKMEYEIWWRTGTYTNEPEPVRIVSHTESTVLALPSWGGKAPERQRKHTAYHDYYPTFEEAKFEVKKRLEEKIASHKKAIERAKGDLRSAETASESAILESHQERWKKIDENRGKPIEV